MARPKLESFEVALIKAMLARGWPNRKIQFFFNTPERPVNSGRISEVKSGARWPEVAPASQYELDDFIDQHPMGSSLSQGEEPQMPSADAAGHIFFVDDDQRIRLVPETPSSRTFNSEELDALFEEIQEKTIVLTEAGHNFLGELSQPVHAFHELVRKEREEILVVQFWSRGNALRKRLAAHDQVGGDEFNPAKLDYNCSERLRDLVEAFNVYVANDPKAAQIDQQRLGPAGSEKAVEGWSNLEPLFKDAREFASEETMNALDEVGQALEGGALESSTEAEIALSGNTAQNFVSALVTGAYRLVRRALGEELPNAWRSFKTGAYTHIGEVAASGITVLVASHFATIRSFVDAVAANPTIRMLLDFMLSLIS